MSGENRFVGSSIEELLVALAQGVREAQIALNAGPLVDANGRPLAIYHLPYLDFSINVEVATIVGSRGRPVALMFTKLPAGEDKRSRQIRSTISGRLVASPAGGGLPMPRIRITPTMPIARKAHIAIEVSNTAGEFLADQVVELNIDDGASKLLSAANGFSDLQRAENTRLEEALLITDAEGNASAVLAIDGRQSGQAIIVVTATAGGVTASTAIPLGTT